MTFAPGPGLDPAGSALTGTPLRSADVAKADGAGSAAYLRSITGFLRAQRGLYLASHIRTVRLAGGRVVLRIEFAAPSPLGLLTPLEPSSSGRSRTLPGRPPPHLALPGRPRTLPGRPPSDLARPAAP